MHPLIVKVGISAVSVEGARANLDAEVPHWDFDACASKPRPRGTPS
jgi:putative alpha-1,2-mannosidase